MNANTKITKSVISAATVIYSIATGGCATTQTRTPASNPPHWVLVEREQFTKPMKYGKWRKEKYAVNPEDRYADNGSYFYEKIPGFAPPKKAFRASTYFGKDHWLQIESYSKTNTIAPSELATQTKAPGSRFESALKISSPEYSNATVVRSAKPLPKQYRVCATIGYPSFGSKLSENKNGYKGDEMATPWINMSSTHENGFYWLAILDSPPMPHNNVYIHHHRKAVIDSDNNEYPGLECPSWSRVATKHGFVCSGERIIMMFVLDALSKEDDRTGASFISHAAGRWNWAAHSNEIRAVDRYLPERWYTACISRTQSEFTLKIDGEFEHAGRTTYENSIDLKNVLRADSEPDFFMLGDPHINFYRGSLYVREISLEVPK